MCSSFSKEETVTVVYTESEARELYHLLSYAQALKLKLRGPLAELDAKHSHNLSMRNWSA